MQAPEAVCEVRHLEGRGEKEKDFFGLKKTKKTGKEKLTKHGGLGSRLSRRSTGKGENMPLNFAVGKPGPQEHCMATVGKKTSLSREKTPQR